MGGPPIRYATSADGTKIAYAVLGSGPPLVLLDTYLSPGLDRRLDEPSYARLYGELSANRSLVLLDWRNSGLSGSARSFSLENYRADVESVINQLAIERFDLCSWGAPSHVALELAASHGSALSKLILWSPVGKGASVRSSFASDIRDLARSNWQVFIEVLALRMYGWTAAGYEYMEQLRKHWTSETWDAMESAVEEFDGWPRANFVGCEALVVVPEELGSVRRAGQALASMLQHGHLRVVQASRSLVTDRDTEHARLVDSFLGESGPTGKGSTASASQPSSFHTILFTDIENHTSMMQRLGDTKGRDVLREHERLTREQFATHSGAEIKTMGDGFMASFGSAQKAVECAIALQKAFASMSGESVRIRVGINAGEPIAEENDLFGSSVILAARTAARAQGGEILVTDVVRQLVTGKGFSFNDRGEAEMKGFEEPVRLFEVVWS